MRDNPYIELPIDITSIKDLRPLLNITARSYQIAPYGSFHGHNFFEIEYIVSGHGIHYINNQRYDISTGDLFGLSPNDYHRYEGTDLIVNNLIIKYPNVPSFIQKLLTETQFPFYGTVDESHRQRICSLFQLLLSTMREKSCYCSEKTVFLAADLLLEYKEHSRAILSSDRNSASRKYAYMAVDLINEKYNDAVTLESIAAEIGISSCYLSRIFKACTGTGFPEFITRKRLKSAQYLLSTTDLQIIEIAYASGFGSICNLNRAFGKYVGLSPSQYRKNSQSIT